MNKKHSPLQDILVDKLRKNLPIVFARKEVKTLLGSTISCGTLANLASEHKGPPYVLNGRHAVYERDSFIEWYIAQLKDV